MTAKAGSPVLSDETGGYREFRAAAALDKHFRCVWSNALAVNSGNTIAVVPDGCIDLIWDGGDLTVAGPDVVAALSPGHATRTIIGVRFCAGAAQKWLGLPMSEIVGARLPLAEFWGARARELAARMSDAVAPEQRMRVLEQALGQMAPDVEAPDSGMSFVFNALKTESAGRGMSIILDRLDMSPRTLRRRCHDAFGYGPKTLDRILRFQRFLALARQASRPELAPLAFEAGYADQAHLTREVRRLSQLSPASVLAQLRN